MRTSFLTKIIKNFFIFNKEYKNEKGIFEEWENIKEIGFENIYLIAEDNITIGTWLFMPEIIDEKTKYLIILHGNAGNRRIFAESIGIEIIVKNNNVVLIPDYRDFGDSEGEFTIEGVNKDIDACIKFMNMKFKINPHIIGYSLGAAITLEYMRFIHDRRQKEGYDQFNKNEDNVGRIILIAPFASMIRILNEQKLWRIVKFLYPFATSTIKKEFNYDGIKNIMSIDPNKIKIYHGEDDINIHHSHSEALQKVSNCKIDIIPGEDHFKIIENYRLMKIIKELEIFKNEKNNNFDTINSRFF